MYSMNDILALLEKGENPEAIAQSFADSLNAAIDQKRKADEAAKKKAEEEAAAKAKAAAIQKQKKEDMEEILDLLIEWMENYYPTTCGSADIKIDADEIIKIFDETEKMAVTLYNKINKAPVEQKNNKAVVGDADKFIADFLKEFGL